MLQPHRARVIKASNGSAMGGMLTLPPPPRAKSHIALGDSRFGLWRKLVVFETKL